MEKRELHSVLTDFLNENLIQATASGQAEKNDFLKARIRPVLAKGVLHFQAEEFIGKQAFHKNLTAEEAAAYLEGLMETSFRQLQLEARDKSSSVLVSKKGKVTVKVKKKPVSGNMFTEKYGTHQCLLAVRENVMRAHHTTVDEAIINRVFRFGTADIKEEYLKTITDTVTDYVEGIFQRLREHEYNPELMRLYVLGGGSCLIRNFGVYDASRVTINDDICATAKGYEYLAYVNLLKNGGTV